MKRGKNLVEKKIGHSLQNLVTFPWLFSPGNVLLFITSILLSFLNLFKIVKIHKNSRIRSPNMVEIILYSITGTNQETQTLQISVILHPKLTNTQSWNSVCYFVLNRFLRIMIHQLEVQTKKMWLWFVIRSAMCAGPGITRLMRWHME